MATNGSLRERDEKKVDSNSQQNPETTNSENKELLASLTFMRETGPAFARKIR